MESNKKLTGISILILALAIAGSFIYYFVVRPIQQDKKLDECLKAAGFVQDNEWYKYQKDTCVKLYGENQK